MNIDELRHTASRWVDFGTRLSWSEQALAEVAAGLRGVRLDNSELIALLSTPSDDPWVEAELVDTQQAHASVFALRSGVMIPLHDHPDMNVVCRVMSGTMRVRTFTWTDVGTGMARDDGDAHASDSGDALVLASVPGQLHEIVASTDCAFLDVFAPYYDETGRPCSYYRICSRTDDGQVRLERLAQAAISVTEHP